MIDINIQTGRVYYPKCLKKIKILEGSNIKKSQNFKTLQFFLKRFFILNIIVLLKFSHLANAALKNAIYSFFFIKISKI